MLRPPVGEAVDMPIVVGALMHEHASPTALRVWHAPIAGAAGMVVVVLVVVDVVVVVPGAGGGVAGAAGGSVAAAGAAGVAGVVVCANDSGTAAERNSAVASTKDRVMELLRNSARRERRVCRAMRQRRAKFRRAAPFVVTNP